MLKKSGKNDAYLTKNMRQRHEMALWKKNPFTSIKVASSWRTPLPVAPEGVLT